MQSGMMKSAILLLLIMLVVTGCGGGAGEGSKAGTDSSAGKGTSSAADAKTLTIANATDIESFDIHNNNNTLSEAVLVNVFDYLFKNDAEGKKVPVLATSWKQLNDTTWRFKLRNDVKFHNGDPFTAADVKFTLERVAKDSSLKQNSYYKQIAAVKVVDDYTVDIVTNGSDPLLLNRLCRMGSGMLPAKYIKEHGMDAFLKAPVGTGPYKFSRWQKDDQLELVKNEHYFGETPKWNKVVFRVIPEASTRVSELLTGGVDIVASVPATDVARIQSTAGLSVVKAPTRRVVQLILRQTKGTATANPQVREAIDLAIDKKAIVDSIAGGAGILTRTSVTPGVFGSDPSLYKQSLYDPERAKQLLKEAGYSNGGPELSMSVSSQYKEYAEVVASMLNNAGFKINLDVLESSAFGEKMAAKKFGEIFMLGIGNSLNDASNNYTRYLADEAKGETDYNNPEVEKLLRAAAQNMNVKEREKQYQQVQQIFTKDRPAVYLYQMEGVYGVGSKVNYKPREDEMYFANEVTPKNG